MSDAAGNAGFEDVLSSIRRLVSEDSREAGSDAGAETAQSKLLLTPALRVEESPEAPQDLPEEPAGTAPVEAPWQEPETTLYQAAAQAHASSALQTEMDPQEGPILLSEADRAKEMSLSAKITALEAAIERARQDGPARPQAPVEPAASQPEVPDAAFVEVEQAEAEQDLLTDGAALLDEESLRELITDIVREELQGAMGERITRNVRKLVRREIHRALTAQELE